MESPSRIRTPNQAAAEAHREAVEDAVREHPDWSSRQFAEYWGDVHFVTVARWLLKYGLTTSPKYGRPHGVS